MGDVTDAVQLAFTKLTELATTYGPKAVDLGATVVQVDAIGTLLIAGVFLFGLLLCAAWWVVCVINRKKWDFYETSAQLFLGLSVCLGIVCLISAVVLGADVWTWVAIFNPKLALAAKIVHSLPGF